MYSKQDILDSLKRENHLILHLHSKIEEKDLDYRPNETQRSLNELLAYMTRMARTLVQFVGDKKYQADISKKLTQEAEAKDMIKDFATAMEEQYSFVENYILNSNDEILNETMDLFGMGKEQSAKSLVLEIAFKNYPAYRMQLFQYLKNGLGKSELVTSNLWMGKNS